MGAYLFEGDLASPRLFPGCVLHGEPPCHACPYLSALTGEQQRYLQTVERFCTNSGNDWYRVYLMRKLTSQRGLDFLQCFSRQGHPCRWVFPKEVIKGQV